jgi:glycosyltransferase involved in cell wall biosynthesis
MRILHLTSSRFFGGPERQMLGLARALRPDGDTVFASFREGGHCSSFLETVRKDGFQAHALEADSPAILRAISEVVRLLDTVQPRALFCHGYKADLVGWRAARSVGVPVVGVSRGWTAEGWKVRAYEGLDRFVLRFLDRVVCVSEGQAEKVRRAGIAEDRIRVIHNAIDSRRFAAPRPEARATLRGMFPTPRRWIVGAAGRLSPEKGIDVLVDAAATVVRARPAAGFIVFGDGKQEAALRKQVAERGLTEAFVFGGFRSDLDTLIPSLDLLALPSWTEGLPNVILEAFAAGVPVVATAVGGVPEVVDPGHSGLLVPPGNPVALAGSILRMLDHDAERQGMGQAGLARARADFTFTAQADGYRRLLDELTPARPRHLLQTAG